jgi:hypothetical protein
MVLLGALTVALAACAEGTAPSDSDANQRSPLAFKPVRVRQGAPGLASVQAQFWARFDRNREVKLYFRPRPGDADSTEFLEFKVPGGSLLRDASGRIFANSDSVLITITVPDPSRFQVVFAPAGLRFNPNRPAELEFSLDERDDDLDGDGDTKDDNFLELGMWRQETPTSLWERIGSVVIEELEDIKADILGFTGYAVAI